MMYKKMLWSFLWCVGLVAVNDANILSLLISEDDLSGVKQILNKNPNLVNALDIDDNTPLQTAFANLVRPKKEIISELLKNKMLDINKPGRRERTLLISLFRPLMICNESVDFKYQYIMIMHNENIVKDVLQHPQIDITVLDGENKNVLDYLDIHHLCNKKDYIELLSLFLDLALTNEKSWNAVLPRFIAMDDVAVMQQIHNKLQNQEWFKKSPEYFWFEALHILSEGSLSKDAARAILDTWARRGRKKAYAQLSDAQKNKANIIMTAYQNAQKHEPSLKNFGKYILTRVNVLAGLPRDVGSVVTSFLPDTTDVALEKGIKK